MLALLYLLRAAGMFLFHISFMLVRDELELNLPMFQEVLDYAGYLPHLNIYVMVSKLSFC